MKVIEKPLVSNGEQICVVDAYDEVEEEYQVSDSHIGARVLPAPFFCQKGIHFYLKKFHQPGEKYYPNGGIEVITPNGMVRSYGLDQIILHPSEIKMVKLAEKLRKRSEKNAQKRDKKLNKLKKKLTHNPARDENGNVILAPKSNRGRKPLSPEEKARREALKAGQPKGKRGRKPLPPEEQARRAELKRQAFERSGGKRGRPKLAK